MMKYLLLGISLVSTIAMSSTEVNKSKMNKSQKIHVANIFADQLIEKFDKELKEKTILSQSGQDNSILKSSTYAQLISAREYIEHLGGEFSDFGRKSLLEVVDADLYNKTVNEIVRGSHKVSEHQKNIQLKEQEKESELVLFPSISSAGNVTGNTFPQNVWSLTFDDGPHFSRTKDVVDNLYQHNMRASFFVLMKQANKYPEAIDNIINSNMELALHSYNHLDLNKADLKTIDYEVSQSKVELEEQTGKEIKIFRLPYGSGMRNGPLRKKIAQNKLVHIFWNVDTLDWKDKDPKSIFARTKLQMELTPKKSGIILFHDVHGQSVIASELVMNYLNIENKKVCVVGDVINYINGTEQTCL